MSLTVKAFLERSGGLNPEIRRFTIPEDVSSSFEYLHKKITEIFPSLRQGKFRLFWKDPEDDLVEFSTDEELMEALGFVSAGVLRVHIKEIARETSSNHGDLHPGIICDGCEGKIYGIRYKCMVCRDYDLCGDCESAGKHKDHDMMKITSPVGHGTPGPSYFGHGAPPMGPYYPRFRHGCPVGPPPVPYGAGFVPPYCRKYMKQFMKHWRSQTDNEGSAGPESGWSCPMRKKKKSEKSRKDEQEIPMSDEDSHLNEEAGPNSEEDYLKTIGEQVAGMLGPLGINVTVDIESGGRRVNCDVKNAKGGQSSQTQQQAPPPTEKSMEAESTKPPDTMNPTAKPGEEEWTVLNGEDGNHHDMTDGAPGLSGISPPTDPRITNALDQILSMGFDNSDGAVTEAVTAYNGDITKALDALTISTPRTDRMA